MSSANRLPVKAALDPDKLTIWPVDDGRYGLDAAFHRASGDGRAERQQQELAETRGTPSVRSRWRMDAAVRPLPGVEVASASSAFVY